MCDACLMAMIEVASAIKDNVNILVASEEIELGTGYEYDKVLSPFSFYTPTNHEFAKHIVNTFGKTYSKITNDYTHSAIDLSKILNLENDIDQIAQLLIYGLENQQGRSVKETINLSKHKNYCTCFDEPTYIDLGHFLKNLKNNLSKLNLNAASKTTTFKNKLDRSINQALLSLNKAIIANVCGSNLKNATGLSIYFPELHIHKSYYDSDFAKNTNWLNFLIKYTKTI